MSGSPVSTRPGQPPGLSEREQRLVEVVVAAASRGHELTREQAGTAAGYGRGEVARVQASRAFKRPIVREALMQALRDTAGGMDAAGSYAVLRHLARKATSERVRLDAALAGARIGGLDTGPMMPGATVGVTVNLMLPGDLGTLLTQAPRTVPNVQVDQGLAHPTHSLPEGEGAQAPGGEGVGRGSSAAGPKRTRPRKTRASLPPPGTAHDDPEKSSPPRKSRGSARG